MDKQIIAKVEELISSDKTLIEHLRYAVNQDVTRVLDEIYKMRRDEHLPYWYTRYLFAVLSVTGDDSINHLLEVPNKLGDIQLLYAMKPDEIERLVTVDISFPIPFVDKYARETGEFIQECIKSSGGFVPDVVILYKNYLWFAKKKLPSSGKSTLPETKPES